MKKLAWGNRVDQTFREKVYEICQYFGWPELFASYLTAIIAFETGRTFSSITRNRVSGALGLIQFMRSTLKYLGYTQTQMRAMTNTQQLDVVKKYFEPYAHKIKDLESMYMAVLWPAAISKSNEAVLFKRGTIAYRQNRGLDKNKNGYITKYEAAQKVREQLEEGYKPENVWIE
jgi:hypothetical protein